MKEKVEIEKVYTRQNNGVVPTLVKFQNGKLSAFTKTNTHFCRLRNHENKNQLGALLVANGNTYHGLINDTEASEMTDTYICIRNKLTNKMTLIPIDQVTLKNIIYQDLDKIKHESLSDNASKITLLKKFGDRRTSRYLTEQQQMRMDIQLVRKELQATVNETHIEDDTDELVDNTKYFNTIRPPINTEAKELSEVYKIEDVVPENLLKRLDEEAKTVYQTQVDQIPIASVYLKKLIQTIQEAPADNESLLRIKLIIYMDCLIRLIKSRVRSLRRAELSDISEKVENNVRERFSDPNANFIGCRSGFSTEKALCHFIVLSLLVVDNYQSDVAILSEELNTAQAKVYKYAHIVQALRKGKTSIICLKLPKDVPPVPNKLSRKLR